MQRHMLYLAVVCLALFSTGGWAAVAADTVVFNEILADPDDDSMLSANSSGYDFLADFDAGEFIELLNRTSSEVDMSGWTIERNNVVVYTFPGALASNTTVLGPNERFVVLQGGTEDDSPDGPLTVENLTGVGGSTALNVFQQFFDNKQTAPGLVLTNGGVNLELLEGANTVDEMSYGGTATAGENAQLNGGGFLEAAGTWEWDDDSPGIRNPDGNIGSGNGDAWVENNVFAPNVTPLRDNVQTYPGVTLRSRINTGATVPGPIADSGYSETGTWVDDDATFVTNNTLDPARGLPASTNETRHTITAGSTATFAPSAIGTAFPLPSNGIYEVSYIWPGEGATAASTNDPGATTTIVSVNEGPVVESTPMVRAALTGLSRANEEYLPIGNYLLSTTTAAATITSASAGTATDRTYSAAVRFRQLQSDAPLLRSSGSVFVIDGNVSEWLTQVPYSSTASIQRSRTVPVVGAAGSAQLVNRDDLNDDTGSTFGDVGGYFYPTNKGPGAYSEANNDCDIDEIRFAWDNQNLYVFIHLQQIESAFVPYVDMTFSYAPGGATFYAGFADAQVSSGLAWERQLAFWGAGSVAGGGNCNLFNSGFTQVGALTQATQDLTNDAYEARIPWTEMGFGPPSTGDSILVTCGVGLEDFGNLREPGLGAPGVFTIGGGLGPGTSTDPRFFDLGFGAAFAQLNDLSNARAAGPTTEIRNSFAQIVFDSSLVPAELSVFSAN